MKVLVTYYSQTGNTEKVAKAIYGAIGGAKDIYPLAEVKDIAGYDIIFVGFPVHAHSIPIPVADFIKKLPSGQKVAFFTTHGSLRGGELARTAIEHAVSIASRLEVLGTFGCQGKVDPKVIAMLEESPEHRTWAEVARGAVGHPDEADLEDARHFAKKVTVLHR